MDPIVYLFIALGVCAVGYGGLFTLKVVRNKKRKKAEKAETEQKIKDNLNEVDGVRYTMEENPVKTEEEVNETVAQKDQAEDAVNLTFVQKDYILPQNTPIEVTAQGELKPGKYLVLSTDENQANFYIRVGIYVREYRHNQEIILAEGDTVCAVSGSVILR